MENFELTKNGIEKTLKNMEENLLDNLNINLQISKFIIQEVSNKKMIRCTISDLNFKYSAVLLPSEDQKFCENDIVKVQQIYGKKNSKSSNKSISLIVIKKFKIINTNIPDVINKDNLIDYNEINSQENISSDRNPLRNIENLQDKNKNNDNNNILNNSISENIITKEKLFLKLNTLSSFTKQKDILIKARVTKKFEKKNFSTKEKTGSLFSFNILDESDQEIPVSAFDIACEKFFDLIKENSVYEISGGYIKINDKKYSKLKSEYKLFLDEKTEIKEIEDDGKIKLFCFNFTKIEDLINIPENSFVDVRAMVIHLGISNTIKTKRKEQIEMKKIKVADSSGYKIEITLWKEKSNFIFDNDYVYAFRNLKVSNFNGKTLNCSDSSEIIKLEDPEANSEKINCLNFQGNFKKIKSDEDFNYNDFEGNDKLKRPIEIKTIKYITDFMNTIHDEKYNFDFYKIKASIAQLYNNEKSYYIGCPECKKKLLEEDTKCQKCDSTFEKPKFYYILHLKLKDHTGEIYCNLFGNIAEKLLKVTCEEFIEIVNDFDENRQKKLFKYVENLNYWFILSPKFNYYQEKIRNNFQIIRFHEIDPEECAESVFEAFNSLPEYN